MCLNDMLSKTSIFLLEWKLDIFVGFFFFFFFFGRGWILWVSFQIGNSTHAKGAPKKKNWKRKLSYSMQAGAPKTTRVYLVENKLWKPWNLFCPSMEGTTFCPHLFLIFTELALLALFILFLMGNVNKRNYVVMWTWIIWS